MKDLLGFLKGKFNVIVLIKAWANDTAKNSSLFQIPKHVALHQTKIVRDEEGSVSLLEKE